MRCPNPPPRTHADYLTISVPLDFNFDSLWKLYLPWDARVFGYMAPSTAAKMPWEEAAGTQRTYISVDEPAKLVQVTVSGEDGEIRGHEATACLQRLVDRVIEQQVFPNVRQHSEHGLIVGLPYFASVERFVTPLLGILSRGAHLTCFVRDGGEIKIWVARRSATLDTYPGMLDTTVAGGVKASDSPLDCILAEADEEAALPADIVAAEAKAVGQVTYVTRNRRMGFINPVVIYVFDLELPEGVIPTPRDDEVEGFTLMKVDEVKKAMLGREFKPNCDLVMIDFFLRHGIITAENDKQFAELERRLRRPLPLPVGPE